MNEIPNIPNENPFSDEDKTFDSVDEFLERLKSDLAEEGFDIEFGNENSESIEVVHEEGEELGDLRVPTNLDIINKQMGPFSAYNMLLDIMISTLNYENRGGDVPFLEV